MENHEKELSAILQTITAPDAAWEEKAKERTSQLVMPPRALGRLHEFSERLCAIQGTLKPSLAKKAVVVMAGDHGVVEEGVSAFPQAVTVAMVHTFLAGGAGINAIARSVGADVFVVDMGVAGALDPSGMPNREKFISRKIAPGTANFTKGPAMGREQAAKAVLAGYGTASALFDKGLDVLGTGDMGIGNTTPSAAVGAAVTGEGLDGMVGRGTGVDDKGLARKKDAIRRALEVNRPDPEDGLDVLSKAGGFEIGGIAGLILAAAARKRPVVVDGFISTAGALIAALLCPVAKDYMFAGHESEEPGHRLMLSHLGLVPVLRLGMRLGEGTGGALAMGVLEGAVRMFTEMMTFAEAAVPGKE
jgi:nicotinate-nucleotide--dimethylbenzimidazole phosphoribosyltransferase